MSDIQSDPTPTLPPFAIPPATLRALVLTLPRPGPDAPAGVWQQVAQAALGELGALDPRDALETLLAVRVISCNAAAADACRIAFEPTTTAPDALRHRANAVALGRTITALLRVLARLKQSPPAPVRDWGDAAEALAAGWQAEPARPVAVAGGAKAGAAGAAGAEPVIRWLDETPDDELAVEMERVRREAAGEAALWVPPGPRRVYMHKPNDYARRWKRDPHNFVPYPGWENMTKPERRAFFGYTYTGPCAPLSMLSAETQAAAAAGEE
jgi:hypothetical protein